MFYLVVFVVGVAFGWVLFEQPQWAYDAKDWFWAKVRGFWGPGKP